MSSEEAGRWCVICCSPADKKLNKTEILEVMTSYLEQILVDMKPADNIKYSLCSGCFEQLEDLHDICEVRAKLKTRIRRDRDKLIKVALKGVQKRKRKGMLFLGVHSEIQASAHLNNLDTD